MYGSRLWLPRYRRIWFVRRLLSVRSGYCNAVFGIMARGEADGIGACNLNPYFASPYLFRAGQASVRSPRLLAGEHHP